MSGKIPRPTELAHQLIRAHVHPGDTVVDATVGNGHDTLFLAQCVGKPGKVYGFDIQQQAIDSTAEKTADMPQVELHLLGHQHLSTVVEPGVAAVMFNLGYLPSGDKKVITQPGTTILAVEAALSVLSPSGIVTIVIYPGHAGGDTEAAELEKWASDIGKDSFQIENYRPPGSPSHSPYLITVRLLDRLSEPR